MHIIHIMYISHTYHIYRYHMHIIYHMNKVCLLISFVSDEAEKLDRFGRCSLQVWNEDAAEEALEVESQSWKER